MPDTDVSGVSAPANSPPAAARSQGVAPQNGVGVGTNSRTKILQFVRKRTRRAPVPAKWRFLGGSPWLRRLRTTVDEFQKALGEEFSLDELLGAGVLCGRTGDAVVLSPVFGDGESPFCIFCDSTGVPNDAISSRGQLSSGAKPGWLTNAAVRHREDYSTKEESLLLLDDADDMLVMRRLGFQFGAAAGLQTLGGDDLRALMETLTARGNQRRYIQTLVGWQVAKCVNAPTSQITEILERLLKVPNLLQLSPPPFDVWLPSSSEFDGFCNALELRDQNLVARLLTESRCRSRCSPAQALTAIGDRAEVDYFTARSRLDLAVRRSNVIPLCAEVAVALGQFERAFHRLITRQFLSADFSKLDVWERWRMLAAGEIAPDWFESVGMVIAARKIVAGQFPAVSENDFDLRQQHLDSFVKLYKLRVPK